MSLDPNQLSIRHILSRGHLRLILLAVALAAVGLTVTGLFLFRSYERVNLELASSSVAFSTEAAVFFGDKDGVAEALATLDGIESVERAEVVDGEDRLLAVWKRPGREGEATSWLDTLLWPKPVVAPIMHDGRLIGKVVMHGSSDGLVAYAGLGLLIALCCIGIILLATRILARQLQDKIVRPLEHVAQVADSVREARDFSLRVEQTGIVEVDRFSREFNDLLSELQGWQDSMQREQQTLKYRAEHDPLTGLGNRTRFDRLLQERIERSRQFAASFSILFIDLDRFKAINDTYGHRIGDLVLCDTARRLTSTVRGRDRAFRLGGDEFAILLDPGFEQLRPHQVAARIEAALLPPLVVDSSIRITIGMSIGVASFPQDGADAESLLHFADTSMYRMKGRALSNGK
ncbi:MAG: diguanylate cyclase [Erythrobacter sp.]|jgi:diguanylate cyclase (GGDEF)-like protein